MSRLGVAVDRLLRLPPGAKEALESLGILTVSDVLWHLPLRYEVMGGVGEGGVLQPGPCTIDAVVAKVGSRRGFRSRRSVVEAVLQVGDIASGGGQKISATWFNQPYVLKKLVVGGTYRFTGNASRTRGSVQLVNPYIEQLGIATISATSVYGSEIMPVYPLTEGVGQHTMRRIARAALALLEDVRDALPAAIRDEMTLLPLHEALRALHAPENAADTEKARVRLAFDEVFGVQLALALTKYLRSEKPAPEVRFHEDAVKTFVGELPFTLTTDQRRAAWEVIRDMEKGSPMQRLLNGDVGSGKTAVAAVVAANAAHSGFQTAFMAPTEILAGQHFLTFASMFKTYPHKVAIWTNSMKGISKDGKITWYTKKADIDALGAEITGGGIRILLGTHALIQEKMNFAALALAVVDEQHRFGVRARQALLGKGPGGSVPHLLSMTATPIPRSLALVAYGDVEVSLLKEKPKDRKPIITRVVTTAQKPEAYEFVRQEIKKGRQAFIVCPLIDPSDSLGITSVTEELDRLKKKEFKGLRLGMLHGKMPPKEKTEVMEKMKKGEIDVLVATSVVEVGVDIPNATVMWIEGAERFGIAQLHQFRGRVGRGAHQSYCFLAPAQYTATAKARLKALEESNDGFALAEKDLKMRGQGDILGDAQSGFGQFRLATISDIDLISKAKQYAQKILAEDPELEKYPLLKQQLSKAIDKTHWE